LRHASASDALSRLDELNEQIKATDKTLAAIQKRIPSADVGQRLDSLDTNVKAIDVSLAALRKTASLKDVDELLDKLNVSINNAGAMLVQIKQALPMQSLASQLAPLDAKLTTVSHTLTDIKRTASLDSISKEVSALSDKLDDANKMLAAIKAPAAGGNVPAAPGDLQKSIADAAALHGKLAEDIGKMEAVLKPKPREMMVVYLHMPNADKLPKTVATVSPLDIEFAHIGSTDDNGQVAAIIPRLKQIVGGRAGCSISVAGYADTLGGDKTNLTLSKKRARAIAEKIKTAFAGSDVQINEAAWGERRLHDWTPDNTAQAANRRVDIAVNCEK
ncbi:MAG TPA: OmpA family protein, partial [Pseudolabrys sp.]|nr:OmpA family protein [Pseudolabrys sp.]